MAGAPLLTLLHAAPPSNPAHVALASGRVSVVSDAGQAAAARLVDNRVSRSDAAPLAPEPETTTVPPTVPPTTAARRAAAPATTRPTVKPVAKAPVRQATPTTKPAAKPAPKPAPKSPAPSGSSSPAPAPSGRTESGGATWYDAAPPGTCAHRTLPFGTVVTVTSQSTGATATCTVSDRGPFVDGLVIDLAKDVFTKLAPLSNGVVQVRISW